jgi:hypothetical protein
MGIVGLGHRDSCSFERNTVAEKTPTTMVNVVGMLPSLIHLANQQKLGVEFAVERAFYFVVRVWKDSPSAIGTAKSSRAIKPG